MASSFFRMSGRSIIRGDWGDYGDILQHGMSMHLPRKNGKIALERTGPNITPITLPGGKVVLTSEAQKLLELSVLTGFSFLPVEKVHIVELHWEDWDLDATEPAEYPESGEPEDYILLNPHSPAAANALGDLWEIMVPETATILRPKSIVNSYKDLLLDLSTWNDEDLVKGSGYGSILFSERAHEWFLSIGENICSLICFRQHRNRLVGSLLFHPVANSATGWGSRFLANRCKKQVLRFASFSAR